MNAIMRFITEKKKAVVIIFAALTILCAFLAVKVSVNYNLTEYLPDDARSTIALEVMSEEFEGDLVNARIMISGVGLPEALRYKAQIAAVDGVSSVIWIDDLLPADMLSSLASLPDGLLEFLASLPEGTQISQIGEYAAGLEGIDMSLFENVDLSAFEGFDLSLIKGYYKDGAVLFQASIAGGKELEATDAIYEIIGKDNALAGEAASNAESMRSATSEVLRAIAILLPIILLILLLTTSSWIEPLLFLLAIGVSVVLNMGSNLIFGEVSYITQSISPILQLAVSLDYAIFLLHAYSKAKEETDDRGEAMRIAMRRSFRAIAASAATTLFGFAALIFMNFGIGVDLGLTLVKGIILSFISVLVFLPALTLWCDGLIAKTRHKKFIGSLKGVGRGLMKIKLPALILVAIIVVPCFLAQSSTDFVYGNGKATAASRTGSDGKKIDAVFGKDTTIVLLVPKGETGKEAALCGELAAIPNVTGIDSYVTSVGADVPVEFIDAGIASRFYSENYSRIVLYVNTDEEGEEAFAAVESVNAKTGEYYDDFYYLGQSAVLYDMKNVISEDSSRVNLIAIIAIFLVLLISFKSLTLPLILLFTIEAAIWINLSVPYFTGSSLCYIGFLVINTVQLGATVDYAILMNDCYMKNRSVMPKKEAMIAALDESFIKILISGMILAASGFCLTLTSSNPIIEDLGLLLGRGTLLSVALVSLVLPALLMLLDKPVEKTTLNAKFFK